MVITCKYPGCAAIIPTRESLLIEPEERRRENLQYAHVAMLHHMQEHPDLQQAVACQAQSFYVAIASKMFISTAPDFEEQEQESFRGLYWCLMGTLHPTKNGEFPPQNTESAGIVL